MQHKSLTFCVQNIDIRPGVLKQDYAFRRFLLRGKKNVLVEFTLLAFAYNIQKLFNKNIKNTNGILLHIPKTA